MKPALLLLLLLSSLPLLAEAPDLPGDRNYLDSLRTFWRTLYPDGGETLYCGYRFQPYDRKVNVEHVYPMNWVVRQLGCGNRNRCRRTSARFNEIESDMHNLYPALAEVNELRGSMPFDEIPGEHHAVAHCDFEVDLRRRRVEPRPEARGRIARAMLYMAGRYGLTLYERQRRLLERWHRRHPPDAAERLHDRLVRRLQGVDNPFID